eukprot:g65025.t1
MISFIQETSSSLIIPDRKISCRSACCFSVTHFTGSNFGGWEMIGSRKYTASCGAPGIPPSPDQSAFTSPHCLYSAVGIPPSTGDASYFQCSGLPAYLTLEFTQGLKQVSQSKFSCMSRITTRCPELRYPSNI